MVKFRVNGEPASFDGANNTPLLWVLRDHLELTGTKFGCALGQCGACSVHIDGKLIRSCTVPVANVEGSDIITIEGLSIDGSHPVQQAWLEIDVPQCGYCQAGQIMTATDLLARIPNPTDDDIKQNMDNLCRCGTYVRIRKAVRRAAEISRERRDA